MKTRASGILFWILLYITNVALAADEGAVTHWPDGETMDCPYFFPEEANVVWDQEGAPPVTIEDVNVIFKTWVDSKYPGDTSFVSGYQLIIVRPWQRDPLWAYFIEYGVFENQTPIMSSRDRRKLAVALNGTVVEPQCNAP